MGRKRGKDKHLPERMYRKSGSYYFVDRNNKWNPLGRDLYKALARYVEFVESSKAITTVSDMLDRYLTEVSPLKAQTTYKGEVRLSKVIRAGLGGLVPSDVTARTIYAYMDARSKTPIQANREFALISHMFKKGIRWGVVDDNPCKGVEKFPEKPRDRYVTDEEFEAFKSVAGEMIATYLDFKLLTGLRKKDILSLKREHLLEEGIYVKASKTGKAVIIEWSQALRDVVERAKRINCRNPNTVRFSHYLFCTRKGTAYTTDGFGTNWQRQMNKAVEKGVLTERFTEHDIRAKAGSDSESLSAARELLGHENLKTTKQVYRRRIAIIKPLK